MYYKTVGLVLRETEYKDADKILTVLTSDRGKVTLRARGVRSKSSKLKAGCQLLAYSEFTVFEGRSAQTVDEAVPIELFMPLREDIELLALGSYFAQVAEVLSQEDAPSGSLLSLTLNSLAALSRQNRPKRLVKSVFELKAACIAGYEPMLDGCAICGCEYPDRFHVTGGVVQCAACLMPGDNGIRLPVSSGALAAMRYVVGSDMKRAFSFRLDAQSEKELSDITETYLVTQLERGFFTLDFYKSLLIT